MRTLKERIIMNTTIRPTSVKLISRYLNILTDASVLSVPERNEIIAQLKNLSARGEPCPAVSPRLINQTELADMLSVSLAQIKKVEREGGFPFKRRMVGSSVRYLNTDVVKFMSHDEADEVSKSQFGT